MDANRAKEMSSPSPPVTHYCLRWNNHPSSLISKFKPIFQAAGFTDVTLACEGASIKCHKLVLAVGSSYLHRLFQEYEGSHPIVILHGIRFTEMTALLEYMYSGVVILSRDQVHGFLMAAETLRVRGFVEEEQLAESSVSESEVVSPPLSPSSDIDMTVYGMQSEALSLVKRKQPKANANHFRSIAPHPLQFLKMNAAGRSLVDKSWRKKDGVAKSKSGKFQHPDEPLRYKQYTQKSMESALEAVREGMSAMKASRRFRVPSRTLYDRVKKLGIKIQPCCLSDRELSSGQEVQVNSLTDAALGREDSQDVIWLRGSSENESEGESDKMDSDELGSAEETYLTCPSMDDDTEESNQSDKFEIFEDCDDGGKEEGKEVNV